MKKTLLLLMTLLTITTNAQLAPGSLFNDGTYNYSVTTDTAPDSPNTVSLTGPVDGVTLPDDLVIPASVNEGGIDYAIKLISSQAFKNKAIKTLTIQGDTEPGHQSFMGCTQLTQVDLPVASGALGQMAFRDCSALVTVNIPNITVIGVQSFKFCSSITTLNLPKVTAIGPAATQGLSFWGCSSLTSVDMPVVEAINTGAFNSCAALPSLTFPSTLTAIDNTNHNMFKGCTSLTSITVEYSTLIPVIYNDAHVNKSIFQDILANVTLTVPNGKRDEYLAAEVWKDFSSINEAATLSVDSEESESGFRIYPNPANNVVSVTNSQLKEAVVTVYDLNGRALLSKVVNETSSEINISNLQTGVYLFNVKTETGEFVKRIAKQ